MRTGKVKSRRRICPACRAVFRKGFARCPVDGTRLQPFRVDPLEGTLFVDRYRIQACIGEGGMGRVYRATHHRMSREFAVKVLFGEHAAEADMQARFKREAEAACQLRHPNVVSVLDSGETAEGLLYLVMDWVDGRSLVDIISKEGPMANDRAIELTRQIADGLAHAHSHGLVHRDLKAENVLIAEENTGEVANIVDFGLAVNTDNAPASRLTAAGIVYGTPSYMAPEQAAGGAIDPRTDLYSLGVLMYEMLAGVLPFEGSSMDIVRQNMTQPPPPIGERAPGVTVAPDLEAIVMRLLAKRPGERYQRALELITDLDTLSPAGSKRRPQMAHVAGPPSAMHTSAAPTIMATSPARAGRRGSYAFERKRRWPIVAAIAASSLALFLAVGFWPRAEPASSASSLAAMPAAIPAVMPAAVPAAVGEGDRRRHGAAGDRPAVDDSVNDAVDDAVDDRPANHTSNTLDVATAHEADKVGPKQPVAPATETTAATQTSKKQPAEAKRRPATGKRAGPVRTAARGASGKATRRSAAKPTGKAAGRSTNTGGKPRGTASGKSARGNGASSQPMTVAAFQKLYQNVGQRIDDLAKRRGEDAVRGFRETYFQIPFTKALQAETTRVEAGQELQQLKRRVTRMQ